MIKYRRSRQILDTTFMFLPRCPLPLVMQGFWRQWRFLISGFPPSTDAEWTSVAGLYERGLEQGLIPLLSLQKDRREKEAIEGSFFPTDSSDSALSCHKIIFAASHTSQPHSDPWKMENEHRKKGKKQKEQERAAIPSKNRVRFDFIRSTNLL